MTIVKRVGTAIIGAAMGALGAAILNGTPVEAKRTLACTNTYCNPGWSHCEYNNWSDCHLKPGTCGGWDTCPPV